MLERSTAWTSTKVRAVRSERFGDPTPCAEWNVAALLKHLIGGARFYESIARGVYADSLRSASGHEAHDDDPSAAYDLARAALLAAFADPRILERSLASHHGERSGAELCGLIASDHLVHGWDLSVATDQDATIPPDLIAPALAVYTGANSPRRGDRFAPALAVKDGGGLQEKLLAYCGRSPNWRAE